MLTVNIDGDLSVTGGGAIDLPLCMIGESGVVIEATGITLHLDSTSPPVGKPAGWKGIHIASANLYLPGDLGHTVGNLSLTNGYIGNGGFSGTVASDWPSELPAQVFGMTVGLSHASLTFVQNTLTASEIRGRLTLPFFDEPVEVEIGIGVEGALHVKLASTDPNGLYKLTKPGLLEIELDSISFELKDGLFTAKIAGNLTPLFGAAQGLKWPTFDVKELSIDSKGHVHLDGGWLTLPQQQTLDFYGFKIEITQLGFGKNDDGSKWVGFSGGLKLVDGLQAGAAVEGLRITWYEDGRDPKISLNGAGVELKIPDVLELKGSVSFRELDGALPGEKIRRFDGDIHLTLETPNIEIDGTLVIGSVKGPAGRYNFFAIYVDVELPTGIPLASTGLGIYGFAGLFALQMEPDKHSDEMWFSIDHGKSFYHRPTQGITDLEKKWIPRKDSFAVGAGITLGTLSDNGYTFNGKFLLAIVIPGPIVLIQGAASFLKKRADGADEGQFRALTVIDGRAGSILIGLDAEYKSGKGGELIDISGSMEAFYAFNDPTAWHLYLGQREPRELRIRALFARLVEANAYFMIDARQLALGAWFGYANSWSFGPLSVTLEAWADGNALLSFKPSHFHGDLWLHALVGLKAFGLGLEIGLDAQIAADLFKPYHLLGKFSVGIKLPWPFKKKIGATVTLEWGPSKAAPPLALPITQVAVEHLKSTVVWPLPRRTFLLPDWDDGAGFVAGSSGAIQPADLNGVPLVPLDARISLTFGRSVHDKAFVGINTQQPNPAEELIGPPGGPAVAKARYELTSLVLERWDNPAWKTVAQSPKAGAFPTLFGSWMPVPALPTPAVSPPRLGQTKLLVGSKTPFDFTRGTGSSWEEWVSDALPGYPCIPELPSHETCFGFAGLEPGTRIESPWRIAGPPALTLSWGFGPAIVETRRVADAGVVRIVNVLCFPEPAVRQGLTLLAAEPAKSFRIILARGTAPGPASAAAVPVTPKRWTTLEVPTCVNVLALTAGTVTNPWSENSVRFTVRGADGGLLPFGRIERWGKGELGFNAGFGLDIELPCASSWVELLVTHRPPFHIVAFNAAGAAVASHAPQGTGGEVTETIRLEGAGIRRLEVHAAGNEKLIHRVCWICPTPTGPSATVYDAEHLPHGTFFPVGDVITVDGQGFPRVVLTGDSPLCLEQLCVTPDPEAGQGVRRDEAIRHIQKELARWKSDGAVFSPHSIYRLRIDTTIDAVALDENVVGLVGHQVITEYAYFRTEGPPGLTKLPPPEGVPKERFDSGLDDLVRYVRATDPSTVPLPGEKPLLFQPFYRAYDIGVEFNEDYVAQMYQMEKRDLGLYLFDASNQLARDARGRLLSLAPSWGRATTLSLSEQEQRWLTLIDAAICLPKKLDPETFPKDATLASAEEGRVLAPVTLYEGRLMPLLLHEGFTGAPPGDLPPGWFAVDQASGGPSLWQVMEQGEPLTRHVMQGSGIGGDVEPDRPGTMLLLADPASVGWTDLRLSVFVGSAGGAVGVVFRYGGPGSWYRFALHERTRRLVKAGPGGVALLAEDHVSSQRNRDYLLTVEAIGRSLRTYVDGEPVFAIEDGDLAAGRIGLYTCQSLGARFTDVRVDDFRGGAPVVYRFQLATSLYANFYHHLHSFEDHTWTGTFQADAEPSLQQAVPFSFKLPEEPETRAYKDLADKALGPAAALQNPQRVEVMRLERTGKAPVLLLRSPEPLGWGRVEMELSRPTRRLFTPGLAGDLKLTDVTFGVTRPEEESVTLLLREGLELTRHRIEARLLPGPGGEPPGDPILLLESFRDSGALARFEIVDQGTSGGPSQWQIEGGTLIQLSAIGSGFEPALPGTNAVTGDSEWTDYRLTVDLRSDSGGSIGMVFRWRDADNHYRLAADATLRYRRLVKVEAGVVSILWEDEGRYAPGEPFRLIVETVGSRLTGYFDNARLFEVSDSAHAAGRVGLYTWNDPTARFEMLEVRRPSLEAQDMEPGWHFDEPFDVLVPGRWSFLDEAGASAPAPWKVEGGELRCEPDPVAWEEPGGGLNGNVYAIAVAGDEVFVGGDFGIAVWTEGTWRALGSGVNGTVRALAVDGDRVYVGGLFTQAGGAPARSIAVWDRTAKTWSALGSGVAGPVRAVAVGGDRVYAGGFFASAGGAGATNIAAWNRSAKVWEPVGGGVNGWVLALATRGGHLYAGGRFTQAGGAAASRVARWDGNSWVAASGTINGAVSAFAVGEGGLYIGGAFTEAGGVAANRIARWTGTSWVPLGGGLDGPVEAIALDGNQVWVGGRFTQAGGAPASRIARWNRAARAWSPVGEGVENDAFALAVGEDRLWAGGRFSQAGGVQARGIAALLLGGTRSAVLEEAVPEDFRLAVRLVPGADGAAAVLLRWQDPGHHLALWLDAERGARRLVRMKEGKAEVLWEDSLRPEAGREHAVTIDVSGDRLVGLVDGVELFDLAAGPAGGRVGLAVRRSPGARFGEMRWAAPEWSCWHAFGEEEWLPAGTRVRVHAGPPSGPASEAGLTFRSAALTGESGRLRLSSRGAELRLVRPDGTPGHARTFLPGAAYAPVPFDVIRKADGTGLFLVPRGPEGAAGPLRLKLTYYRDRPEAGRRFSQAGDRSAERVAIDIP
ncbi:MAG TPA: hypothetical protein VF756_24940 [Thermoanaerobaculia bacterium]